MRTTIKLLVILALVIVTLNFVMPVSANPPLDMNLSYSNGVLSVTIYHPVISPDTTNHYIETVEIYLDNELELEEPYTTQPAIVDSFTYEYNISAYPGDTIRVTATCSLGGNFTETLEVPPGPTPLEVDLESSASSVQSSQTLTITVAVESADEPIEEAMIKLSDDGGGTFSDVEDKGDGTYEATYTAPEVVSDTTVTITAKASKASYIDGDEDIEITVTPGSSKKDDDDSTPGFEGALTVLVLACMVLIYFVNRRRNR